MVSESLKELFLLNAFKLRARKGEELGRMISTGIRVPAMALTFFSFFFGRLKQLT